MGTDRRQRIVEYVSQKGFASPDELAQLLAVSAVTVRRDLSALEGQGLLERVHGGARIPDSVTLYTPYVRRREQNTGAKEAIAAHAVTLIRSGQTVLLDAGTTCCAVAQAIPPQMRLRVITHSLASVVALREKPGVDVVCTGGQYDRELGSFVGPAAERALAQYHADVSFLGAAHANVEQGLVNNHLSETNVKRMIHDHADTCYLLVDSSKLGVRGLVTTLAIEEFRGTIVTDSSVSQSVAASFREHGVALVTV